MRDRLLLPGAALVAFGASLGSGFHFDDYAILSDRLLTSSAVWRGALSTQLTGPLTWLTFWLNYLTGGHDPLGYHLVNLALHLGAVLLAYECLAKLMPKRAALAAAAVFAIHPMQAEAVNYISARGVILAAVFCLGALLAWLDERRWLAVLCFGAAVLAKEECAAFPLVLLLIPREKKRAAGILPLGVMFGLAVAGAARVIYASGAFSGHYAGYFGGITPWKYFLAQGVAILRYLRLLIVPYGFTIDPPVSVPPVWLGLLAWGAVIALAVLAWLGREKGWPRWVLAGLVILLPSSSIFPGEFAADRRMYLPMFCFSAAAGLLLARAPGFAAAGAPQAEPGEAAAPRDDNPLPALLAGGVIVVLTIMTVVRTAVWMDDAWLWREAVSRAPGKARPKIRLSEYVRAGEALELLSQAREIAPYDPEIPARIGKIRLKEQQPDAALDELSRAVALDPANAENFNNRGVAFAMMGATEPARADFQHALELDPDLKEARTNLQKLPPAQ